MTQRQSRADMIGAADRSHADDRALQVFHRLVLALGDKTKKRRLDAGRNRAHGKTFRRAADDRADQLDIVDVAADQSRHRDVGAHLDDLDFSAVFKIEAAILGDKRHEEGQRAGRHRDADFVGRGFFLSRRDAGAKKR